ncbi:hypothetical protein DVH24_002722 [Malus domestica]|uniref:Glutaredoxin domain-containing protein n=2 Tax=Malus TaxID=3749 RepID=A0A498K8K5_MALDO|nr:hypothetical protein DVH24_002722 [Malus domestica]
METVRQLASEKAAVIFTKSSCCICHSVKTLFYELGASPAIHELDRYANGRDMEWALRNLGCNPALPAVFIGGKYVGSSKDIISYHNVRELASEKAAVIFTKSSCCICHSVKTLFYELGASPAIHELDRYANGRDMECALRNLGCNPALPAVFIGGKYVGSSKDIISYHFSKMDKVMRLASEKGVVIFSKSSCCLCYAVKILFQEIGVSPVVHEIDQDPEGREMEKALTRMGCTAPVPAVFIGGNLIGSTNEVMSLHLKGQLIPKLKPYQQ